MSETSLLAATKARQDVVDVVLANMQKSLDEIKDEVKSLNKTTQDLDREVMEVSRDLKDLRASFETFKIERDAEKSWWGGRYTQVLDKLVWIAILAALLYAQPLLEQFSK